MAVTRDPQAGRIEELLKDRPVLVTGADGFAGSHLVDELVQRRARVHVLVRATSSGALHNILHIRENVCVHRGELTDKEAVCNTLRALQREGGSPLIFHLGAQAHVGESWGRPYETIETNIKGTLNILQSVVDLNLEARIDIAGSSEEYGNLLEEMRHFYRFDDKGGLILDETSPVNPQSPYGTAKLAADFLARNFYRAYGVPAVVTRMFNNYGPRQSPRFITGTIITQALLREVVRLGYVSAKRDFCYVKDGVMGHLHVALFGNPGEVYVYGSGRSTSILEWYEMIIRIGRDLGFWGERRLETETAGRTRRGQSEVEELRVDFRKLNALSGWSPQYDWERGLRETICWYAANHNRWTSRIDWL
jgi:dTDP-glucose 4,6-dehydratase